MKDSKNKFIVAGCVLIVIVLGVFLFFSGRITPNPDFETGNTAGNLNNKGLFCERDGIVYFSNAYDNNVLYSMHVDESGAKRLNDVGVYSINADSNCIFYSQSGSSAGSGLGYVRTSTGMYYCDHKGKKTFCYTKDPVGILALSGNHLFYQHYQENTGVPLIKVSLDKKESVTAIPDMVSPASVVNGTIYYAGNGEDHYLYALDTITGASTLIWKHPLWNPVYHNGTIFFMDLDSNYALHSYNLATGEELALTKERIDFFNVYGTVIYYQTADTSSPALKRIYIDGTGEETVMEGIFESVNITSMYAYFNEYGKPTPVYHQSTYGAVNPGVFNPTIQ